VFRKWQAPLSTMLCELCHIRYSDLLGLVTAFLSLLPPIPIDSVERRRGSWIDRQQSDCGSSARKTRTDLILFRAGNRSGGGGQENRYLDDAASASHSQSAWRNKAALHFWSPKITARR
jgi:hypothetical protein